MADRTSFLCDIRHRKLIYGCSLLLLMGWMSACKKEETPVNPYNAVDYSSGNENDTVPDPASITGLHKKHFFQNVRIPDLMTVPLNPISEQFKVHTVRSCLWESIKPLWIRLAFSITASCRVM
ncbi:MAG: hypothetical protein IPM91_02575 [Bacteroidetes bacterium]|nr:hypothetical protein [Bacteroidota bacterium]